MNITISISATTIPAIAKEIAGAVYDVLEIETARTIARAVRDYGSAILTDGLGITYAVSIA